MMSRIFLVAVCAVTILGAQTLTTQAQSFDLPSTDDVEIKEGVTENCDDDSGTGCPTNSGELGLEMFGSPLPEWIFRWTNLPSGMVAGDGTFRVTKAFSPNASQLAYELYEITGGDADWEEEVVTYDSLLDGAGAIGDILGPVLASGSLNFGASGAEAISTDITVPQATIQRLVDGTSSGLMIRAGAPNTDMVLFAHEWNIPLDPPFEDPAVARPRLIFSVVPEPTSMSLIGLCGLTLAMLRRRL